MFVLLFFLAQSGTAAADWITITKAQIESARVVKLAPTQRVEVDVCKEASFESTGLDFITESSFNIIVVAVVDRSGRVQRFRIPRKPSTTVDTSKPIREALEEWRYKIEASLVGEAFEMVILFPKSLGAMATSACQKH